MGYEIDPHYGLPASRLWEPSGLQLDLSDFTACRPGNHGAEPVDLLVCNPPYVRHHHIERSMKRRLGREATEQLGIRVSGLAGPVRLLHVVEPSMASSGQPVHLADPQRVHGRELRRGSQGVLAEPRRPDPDSPLRAERGAVRRRAGFLGRRMVPQQPSFVGLNP